jgi:hypothetical protein
VLIERDEAMIERDEARKGRDEDKKKLEKSSVRMRSLQAQILSITEQPRCTSDGVDPSNIQWIPRQYRYDLGKGGYKK